MNRAAETNQLLPILYFPDFTFAILAFAELAFAEFAFSGITVFGGIHFILCP